MDPQKLQVIVEILKKGEGAQQVAADLKQIEASSKQTTQTVQGMSAAFGVAIVALGGLAAVRSSLQAVAQAREAVENLNGRLRAGGQYSAEYSKELQKQAIAFKDLAKGGKDAVLAAEGTLVTFGAAKEQMPEYTMAVLDLAAGMKKDVPQAAFAFGKAIGGQFESLREFGIRVREDATNSEKMADALDQIRQRFGGMASAMSKTDVALLAKAENALGGIKKELGEILLVELRPFLQVIVDLGKGLNSTAKEASMAKLVIVDSLEAIAISAGALGVVMFALKQNARLDLIFGAAAIASVADARAAIILLSQSVAPVILGIAALTAVVMTLVEAYKMLKAQEQERVSAGGLTAQNEKRIEGLRQEIAERERLGRITAEQAATARKALEEAAKANFETKYITNAAAPVPPVQIRNPRADQDALNDFQKQYLPPLASSAQTSGSPTTAELNAADALQKLKEKIRVESLQGEEREQALIQQNYNERLQEIRKIAETEKFSDAQLIDANMAAVMAKEEQLTELSKKKIAREEQEASQIQDFQDQLHASTLGDFEKEDAMAQSSYEKRARLIQNLLNTHKIGLSKEEELNELNDYALMADKRETLKRREEKNYQAATEKMRLFEEQLTGAAIGSSEKRSERVAREFETRLKFYDDLKSKGLLTEKELIDLRQKAALMRDQGRASMASEGLKESDRLKDNAMTPRNRDLSKINREFEIRKENLNAYYDLELQRAQGNAERVAELEAQKTANMLQMTREQTRATSDFYSVVTTVGSSAASSFSSGFANAFLSFVNGTKSAGEAFLEFTTTFLSGLAQLILQTLIFNAIKASTLGGALGLSGGGQVISDGASGAGASMAARGGFFPIMAAAGVMAAAGGVAGVQEVSSATYFPRHNVIAGEAGREVMTVMARPQLVDVDGIRAQVGNVGPNRLALMSEADFRNLTAMRGPRMMAAGGMAGGGMEFGLGAGPSRSGSPGISGQAIIEVRAAPGNEARIIKQAIEGARIQVTQDMGRDTQLAAVTKGLVS